MKGSAQNSGTNASVIHDFVRCTTQAPLPLLLCLAQFVISTVLSAVATCQRLSALVLYIFNVESKLASAFGPALCCHSIIHL